MTFWGCALAGVITSAVFLLSLLTGPGLDALNDPGAVAQGTILVFGVLFLFFIAVGPTLAWGLGFALRTQTNQYIHVLAFAVLGLFLGFMLGGLVGVAGVLGPAAGVGVGLARWIMNPHAKL